MEARVFLIFFISGVDCFPSKSRRFPTGSLSCPVAPVVVGLDDDDVKLTISSFDANVTSAVRAAGPAVAVGLILNQDVVFSKGYGLVNVSDKSRGHPTPDTGFRIGSLTKIFTVIELLQLRDAGRLSLNDPVTRLLPNFSIKNPFHQTDNITLHQLASHMGGLPREAPCANTYNGGCDIPYDEIYKRLTDISLIYPPGVMPLYSNLGFALLGRAMGAFVNRSWEEYVKEEIVVPLNLTMTGTKFSPDVVKKMAVGYMGKEVASLASLGWEAPAGDMYSSVNDLSKLMALVFRDTVPYKQLPSQILDGETIREWMHPVYVAADRTGYCLPWELIPNGNYQMRCKAGAVNGYRAELLMIPEIKAGVVVLQASEDEDQLDHVLAASFDLLLSIDSLLKKRQPPPNISNVPSDYVGIYVSNVFGSEVKVEISIIESVAGRLLHSSLGADLIYHFNDTFYLTLRYQTHTCHQWSDSIEREFIYFTRSGNTVTSFEIPGLEYGRVYKKVSSG